MSHEIRTPLNAIVGFANIIATDDGETFDAKERKTFIDTMNQNCELLLNLIGDILEISRIESGNISMSFKKQNVNNLVRELYNTYHLLVKPSIDLKIELYPEPIWANVDKHRFSQVIINFLSNANKFTDVGYIKLGSQFDAIKGEITVYVEDTGKGIPKEEQKMIFERFYKRDEFAQSTGLGLSICKSIAEKHCGRIELHSELGKGSRFEFILPAITDQIKTN